MLMTHTVMLNNCIDPPPMGKIKDFKDKDMCVEIVWTSGASFGQPTIYPFERIQLVCTIERLLAEG